MDHLIKRVIGLSHQSQEPKKNEAAISSSPDPYAGHLNHLSKSQGDQLKKFKTALYDQGLWKPDLSVAFYAPTNSTSTAQSRTSRPPSAENPRSASTSSTKPSTSTSTSGPGKRPPSTTSIITSNPTTANGPAAATSSAIRSTSTRSRSWTKEPYSIALTESTMYALVGIREAFEIEVLLERGAKVVSFLPPLQHRKLDQKKSSKAHTLIALSHYAVPGTAIPLDVRHRKLSGGAATWLTG
ncbi:MAG: hypothetical protein FRX48_08182 [Lasallia pustulata]|uniref:Uncharacterized protein n=1 Tax=Lasallia pustulata TaxID=136370 RepID=A0A5M8PEU7_9LECA|nr:MAG: hypothetical protein FRX48_08182 [Lasallia pustulata]